MEPQVMTGVAFRHKMTETIGQIVRGQIVTVTNYGRPVAVVVPPEWYERAAKLMADATQNDE